MNNVAIVGSIGNDLHISFAQSVTLQRFRLNRALSEVTEEQSQQRAKMVVESTKSYSSMYRDIIGINCLSTVEIPQRLVIIYS